MVQEKRIRCPHCQSVLNVKNPKGLEVMDIVCPKCRARLRVKFQATPSPQPVYDVGGGADSTVLGGNKQRQAMQRPDFGRTIIGGPATSLKYRLVLNGYGYDLKDGENTIGRRANTSDASVQIMTESRKMSRKHAKIMVTSLGGINRVSLSNWENKNTTCINDVPLGPDSSVKLKNGDKVKMGDVVLTFEEYEA